METKVRLKNLYLIAVITIGLIGLGLGSTFAMFTASANIDNPIVFNSNLTTTNLLAETVEVVVPSGEDKYVDLVISNTNANSLNYTAWYTPSSNDLLVGSESSNNSYGPAGTLPSAGNFTLTVGLRNSGSESITVTIGVSSSSEAIVLPSGVTSVPSTKLPYIFSLSDFTYVLGTNQTTISSLSADFYNSSNQTISEQNNVTLPASISIAQNEVLLVRYIGTETEVNIPNTFTDNGNTYNVVLLSYVNNGSNLSTGVFYKNDSIEKVSFGNALRYISLNSSSNGYDNNSISNMFNGCTSLDTVSNIPNTITNMEGTFTGCTSMESAPTLSSGVTNINNLFSGCTSLTSIDLSNVDLNDVTTYTNALNGVSTSANITVSDCDQYAIFRGNMFGYNYTNLSFENNDNSNLNCYQKVQYIESTGTQFLNTGYIPKTNTKLELELSFNGTFNTSTENGGTGTFFGAANYNDNAYTINFGAQSTQYNTIFPWFNKTYGSGAAAQSFKITDAIRTNKNTLTVSSGSIKYGTVSKTITSKTGDQGSELFIFGSPTKPFSFYNMRVYKLTLSEAGDVKKLFVPCYRIVDGEIGLYDTVNNELHINVGTGTFVKGTDVNN